MTSVVLSVRSLPSRVWSDKLCSEALSSATLDLILPCRYTCSSAFRPVGIVLSPPQSWTFVSSAAFCFVVQSSANHSTPIERASCTRFSPIHF